MDELSYARIRTALASLLLEHSIKRGRFQLASGKKTSVYCDVKKTALTGHGAQLIGLGFWQLITQFNPEADAIGGLTLGADPLVVSTAIAAHQSGQQLDAIIVRKAAKSHGTQEWLEMPSRLEPGSQVVAADDVVTTGGSTIDAIEKLREYGHLVTHAVCVVDREDVGERRLAEVGVTLLPLFRLSELLEEL